MFFTEFVKRFFGLEKEVGEMEQKLFHIEKGLHQVEKYLWHNHKPILIFTTIINKSTIKILKMNLDVQDFVDTNLALVDHTTQAPIEATFDTIVLASSDETIFIISDVNSDGISDIVGVAPSTANLTVTANASYTDGNTGLAVTAPVTATVPVTVTAPVSPESVDLVVTFTAEQPVPVTPAPPAGS